MAKKPRKDTTLAAPDLTVGVLPAEAMAAGESKIEEFAEDLGRLLGTARAKAAGWIGQRQAIAKHLEEIRDTATGLLTQLTGTVAEQVKPLRRGRPPKESVVGALQPAPKSKKQRRKMSAEARERIAAAQRARWAKQKSGK